jgi:hypothetical protein
MSNNLRHLITALAVTLLASGDAAAHTAPTERAVLVQVGSERADVMIVYKEPAGERAQLLMTRLDFNRSGTLDEAEQALAQAVMGGLMLRGLQLEVAGERPGVLEPSFKIKVGQDGAIEAAALVSYQLDRLGADARRVFVVRLLDEPGVVNTSVSFQGVAAQTEVVAVQAGEQPPRSDRPIKLTPGDQASATVAVEAVKQAAPNKPAAKKARAAKKKD